MPYVTKTDMIQRFGDEIPQLLDRNQDGAEDAGVFAAAVADADALVNGYLAGRYTLPLASTPALVREIAADLTRYELWGLRAPEEVRRRYEDAIARLRDIAKGVIVLSDGAAPIPSAGADFAFTQRTRTFTDSTLEPFMNEGIGVSRWN